MNQTLFSLNRKELTIDFPSHGNQYSQQADENMFQQRFLDVAWR